MSVSTPTYLHRNSYNIFYFRFAIPLRLRYVLNLTEIKRSLRTKNRAHALKLARRYVVCIEDLLKKPGMNKNDIDELFKTSTQLKFKSVGIDENGQIKVEGVEFDPDKPAEEESAALKSLLAGGAPVPPPVDTRFHFKEAAENYLEFQAKKKGWNDKTKSEYKSTLQTFADLIGDIPMEEVSFDTAEAFRDLVMQLPPNRKKAKRWRGMSDEQILKHKPDTVLSVKTVNKYVERLAAMFDWAMRREIVTKQPFVDLKLRDKRKASAQRKIFSSNDLQALFDPAIFVIESDRPHRYWLPLIAIYSGLRMEEAAQLALSDIKYIDGVLCFDINLNEDWKKLKTANAERIVPVSSQLINNGLERFIAMQKLMKHERLFPELKKSSGKFSHNYSKYFSRYRKKAGVVDVGKAYHSFRHNVATVWKQAQIHEAVPATLLGHSAGGITYTRYGKGYDPKELQKVIEVLKFQELNNVPIWP